MPGLLTAIRRLLPAIELRRPRTAPAWLARVLPTTAVRRDVSSPVGRLQRTGATARRRARHAAAHGATSDRTTAVPGSPLLRANALLAASIRGASMVDLIEAGAAYLDAEETALAERCLTRVDDASGRASFLLGQCAFRREEYDRASEQFEQAVARGWNEDAVRQWHAVALFEIDRYEEAEALTEAALASVRAESRPDMLTLAGKLHLAQGRVVPAAGRFAEALALSGTAVEALYGAGLCALAAGELAGAGRHFDRLATLPAGADLAVLGSGFVAAARNDTRTGIDRLRAAVGRFPSHGHAHLCLGRCLFDAADYDAARAHFARAHALGAGDPASLLRAGVASLIAGDLEAACQTLVRCCEHGDTTARGHLVVALRRAAATAVAAGDFELALRHTEESVRWMPAADTTSERHALLLYTAARHDVQAGQSTPATTARFTQAADLHDNAVTRAGLVVARVLAREPLSEDLLRVFDHASDGAHFTGLVRLVAAYVRQDAAAVAAAAQVYQPPDDLSTRLRTFVRLHSRSWMATPDHRLAPSDSAEIVATVDAAAFRTAFGAQRDSLNRVVASLLYECQGRRRPELVARRVEDLVTADRTGYWSDARLLARLLELVRSDHAVFLDRATALITLAHDVRTTASLSAAVTTIVERGVIARWLADRRYGDAHALLERLVAGRDADEMTRQGAAALNELLEGETPEAAALASAARQPDRARAIWERLASRGDADAAHHLAASLFSKGYDEVVEKRGEAGDTLASALPFWKAIHESDPFWEQLRVLCEQLHSNKYPFRAEELRNTRSSLPFDAVAVLGELSARLVRSGDRAAAARSVVAIQSSPFGDAIARRVLEDVFAVRLLPHGPLSLSHASPLRAASAAAGDVLDCDPHNQRALLVALEAAHSQSAPMEQGELSAEAAKELFVKAQRHLDRFPSAVLAGTPQLTAACKTFWREFARWTFRRLDDLMADFHNARTGFTQDDCARRIRSHVDCVLAFVVPACERWTPREVDLSAYKDLDSQLASKFPRSHTPDW